MVPTKPLLRLCAGDIMATDLVMVPQEMSLQGAARMLSRAHIHGAPVVDADGCCVGVLSSSDFLHWAETGGKPTARKTEVPCFSWKIFDPGDHCETRVADMMTKDPVMVSSSTRIGELARMMIDAHIHRVIVVDSSRKPIGIVSCTNLLAALAQEDTLDSSE